VRKRSPFKAQERNPQGMGEAPTGTTAIKGTRALRGNDEISQHKNIPNQECSPSKKKLRTAASTKVAKKGGTDRKRDPDKKFER